MVTTDPDNPCKISFTLPDFKDGSPFSGSWGAGTTNFSNLHLESGPNGDPVGVYDINWEAECLGECPDIDIGDGMESQKCNPEDWEGTCKLKVNLASAFGGNDKKMDECVGKIADCLKEYPDPDAFMADSLRLKCMNGALEMDMGTTNEDGTKKTCKDQMGEISKDSVIEAAKALIAVIADLMKEEESLAALCVCGTTNWHGGDWTSSSLSRLIQGHADKINEITMKRSISTGKFRNSSSNF